MKKVERIETKAYKAYQKAIEWAEGQDGKARRLIRRFKAHQELIPIVIEGLDGDVDGDEKYYQLAAGKEIEESLHEFLELGWITQAQFNEAKILS